LLLIALGLGSVGCDSVDSPSDAVERPAATEAQKHGQSVGGKGAPGQAAVAPLAPVVPSPSAKDGLPESAVAGFEQRSKAATQPSLSRLPSDSAAQPAIPRPPATAGSATEVGQDDFLPRRRLGPLTLVDADPEKLATAGLHVSRSEHLILITDHPELESFAEFHEVVRQAIGQWTEFFGADQRRFATWSLTCFLVVDEAKFASAGLLPGPGHLAQGKLPPGGWQFGNQIWVRHQPGPYYTRHMLLHEGTHAFCAYNFGALGPPWLTEGLAEFLAVHRWSAERLELAAPVKRKEDVPYWGRVKLIQDAYQTGAPKSLLEVLRFPPNAFPQTEAYAWSWAAVSLWAGHPDLSAAFRSHLQKLGSVTDQQWTRDLLQAVNLSRDQLETQWQVDTGCLRYGHDFARTAIRWKATARLEEQEATVWLPADGAWHSSGWQLPPGRWRLTASGSYTVAEEDGEAWIAEPGGITIAYVQGAPIGQVQYALQGDRAILAGMSELTRPQALGSEQVVTTSGEVLFLRINDLSNQLDDNQGQVEVRLERLAD
jgi:hypothetical protein